MKISIDTEVNSTLSQVWEAWVTPADIQRWNYASDDWCCPSAEVNLEVGGRFTYRMEAKDGSMGFDFEGTFTKITPQKSIHYRLHDNREVIVDFKQTANGVTVSESFDADDDYSDEQQQQGWQAILDNFTRYVESQSR